MKGLVPGSPMLPGKSAAADDEDESDNEIEPSQCGISSWRSEALAKVCSIQEKRFKFRLFSKDELLDRIRKDRRLNHSQVSITVQSGKKKKTAEERTRSSTANASSRKKRKTSNEDDDGDEEGEEVGSGKKKKATDKSTKSSTANASSGNKRKSSNEDDNEEEEGEDGSEKKKQISITCLQPGVCFALNCSAQRRPTSPNSAGELAAYLSASNRMLQAKRVALRSGTVLLNWKG